MGLKLFAATPKRNKNQKLLEVGKLQQKILFNYEIRNYLIEKFDCICVYCGKKNVFLVESKHYPP